MNDNLGWFLSNESSFSDISPTVDVDFPRRGVRPRHQEELCVDDLPLQGEQVDRPRQQVIPGGGKGPLGHFIVNRKVPKIFLGDSQATQ